MTRQKKISELKRLLASEPEVLTEGHCELFARYTKTTLAPGPIGEHNKSIVVRLYEPQQEAFEQDLASLPPLPESFVLIKLLVKIIENP